VSVSLGPSVIVACEEADTNRHARYDPPQTRGIARRCLNMMSEARASQAEVIGGPDGAPSDALRDDLNVATHLGSNAEGLRALSVGQLLTLNRGALKEPQRRGVLRTANAPLGDYAEYIVRTWSRGELAPNAEKSWDVRGADGRRLQVKARVVVDPPRRGDRQLSIIRSFDFDALIAILFDDDLHVWRAVSLPPSAVQRLAWFQEYVNGHRLLVTDRVIADPEAEDLTNELRAAQGGT
jgi:hypothetical protein